MPASFRPGSYAPGNYDTQRTPRPTPWAQERVNYNSAEEQNKREGIETTTTPGQSGDGSVEPQNGGSEPPASTQPLSESTYDELMEQAQEKDVEGRSSMNKEELVKALSDEEPKDQPEDEDDDSKDDSKDDDSKDDESDEPKESGEVSAMTAAPAEGEEGEKTEDSGDVAKKATAKKATAKKATMKKAATKNKMY